MKLALLLAIAISCSVYSSNMVAAEILPIGLFSSGSMVGWEVKSFERETNYSIEHFDNELVLKAVSDGAASGLFKKTVINLKEYPYLNWRWRINGKLPEGDEQQKEGDDYVARLYVIRSGGLFFWRTKALNFVWSSRGDIDNTWPNAFAPDNNRMVAVRSMHHKIGQWYTEKRNVYEYFKDWLGEEIVEIHAVAIMTDTDNTGGYATAFYGDIYFSRK
ncbi:DUF3047 domain-containing protein [Alkalimarinus sediminis]|uniref:DUF3047 domain-containing protein n=1 Tax=Alkalimarinus sediminis TaxID=1632866 RepID=A0A9E8KNW6_9ALTE|nr:DUF3047 domain-containing protein [Alkalimarinus sediminis]UZW73595.1 DUF3047 domain-containing protein [Alkalimarinus sediminis]